MTTVLALLGITTLSAGAGWAITHWTTRQTHHWLTTHQTETAEDQAIHQEAAHGIAQIETYPKEAADQ